MAPVTPGRMTADIDGEFVVFLIGMRFNRPWKVGKWWGAFTAMPRMLRELAKHPELGLLGWMSTIGSGGPVFVQYWRSAEQLQSFARNPDFAHLPAWRAFNRTVGGSGDVGVWHETYAVGAGRYEALYVNMPRWGLAAAGEHLPVARKGDTAAQRMSADGGV
ncbi:hypothetical protein F4553_002857 [Allocatelliglobosispora scoriae]|uniref:DUF4188 domain-containing protein n=1 Tax=Allocatelliglobosispora scoriae TaxID=643052 RepID=A0A841BQ31_9ACTN|nr:DUF4188 domain-containing protein [Allocatelliglobosispora scoriae]MBB5869478.1 hypothetical protein [Allocatelliglobosispora scoriae]